jgi:hypothetical protein
MHVKEPLPELFEHIERIKRLPNVKFGGVVTMLGWAEGDSLECASAFDKEYLILISDIRKATGVKNLPVILSQNEENAIRDAQPHYIPYYAYSDIVSMKIAKICREDETIHICPKEPMAREYYCNGHHYNKQGYEIFASESARLLK